MTPNHQPTMDCTPTDGPIFRKTKELCQTILEQAEIQTLRAQVESFLADDQARNLYRRVVEQGEALHEKQHRGVPLADQEIADYEHERQTLLNNPVARAFLEAQEQMHRVRQSIGNYVAKTLELGHLPTDQDLSASSCGSGCDCHH